MKDKRVGDTEIRFDARGEVDEIVNDHLHIERMEDSWFWAAIKMPDGRRIMLDIRAVKGKVEIGYEVEDPIT